VRQRKGKYWPFVLGFIIFALFAFFVELVPYLPSYGGYVRFTVGIIVTLLIGCDAIVALNRYRAEAMLAEAQPDKVRRVRPLPSTTASPSCTSYNAAASASTRCASITWITSTSLPLKVVTPAPAARPAS
jgi:hypothetical protein